ncbi:MAG: twin-arginine translocation signal domain-containing protein, partial [Planctomycetota bacterium]
MKRETIIIKEINRRNFLKLAGATAAGTM